MTWKARQHRTSTGRAGPVVDMGNDQRMSHHTISEEFAKKHMPAIHCGGFLVDVWEDGSDELLCFDVVRRAAYDAKPVGHNAKRIDKYDQGKVLAESIARAKRLNEEAAYAADREAEEQAEDEPEETVLHGALWNARPYNPGKGADFGNSIHLGRHDTAKAAAIDAAKALMADRFQMVVEVSSIDGAPQMTVRRFNVTKTTGQYGGFSFEAKPFPAAQENPRRSACRVRDSGDAMAHDLGTIAEDDRSAAILFARMLVWPEDPEPVTVKIFDSNRAEQFKLFRINLEGPDRIPCAEPVIEGISEPEVALWYGYVIGTFEEVGATDLGLCESAAEAAIELAKVKVLDALAEGKASVKVYTRTGEKDDPGRYFVVTKRDRDITAEEGHPQGFIPMGPGALGDRPSHQSLPIFSEGGLPAVAFTPPKLKVWRVNYDGQDEFVEAGSFSHCVEVWRANLLAEFKSEGCYESGDEGREPDAIELVSKRPVVREQFELRVNYKVEM